MLEDIETCPGSALIYSQFRVIEGLGIFATETIRAGTDLGMTHLIHNKDIFRTPLGGFLNHSDEPNCKRIELDNKWYLETTKDINKNEELTLSYTMYNPS